MLRVARSCPLVETTKPLAASPVQLPSRIGTAHQPWKAPRWPTPTLPESEDDYSKETGYPNVHNHRCCRRPYPNQKNDAARRKGRIRLQKIDALISTGAALYN